MQPMSYAEHDTPREANEWIALEAASGFPGASDLSPAANDGAWIGWSEEVWPLRTRGRREGECWKKKKRVRVGRTRGRKWVSTVKHD